MSTVDTRESKRPCIGRGVSTTSLGEDKPQVVVIENIEEHSTEPAEAESIFEEHLPLGITETAEEKREKWFVGSIDQGTTSSRFLVFSGEGEIVASHQIEFENLYPDSG